MERKNLVKNIVNKIDGLVCGREYKEKFLPYPGAGVYSMAGSDCYGYIIVKVSDDYRYFYYRELNYNEDPTKINFEKEDIEKCLMGVFVTRKNNPWCGTYAEGWIDDEGKLKHSRCDTQHVGCSEFGHLRLSKKFVKTELDPSF